MLNNKLKLILQDNVSNNFLPLDDRLFDPKLIPMKIYRVTGENTIGGRFIIYQNKSGISNIAEFTQYGSGLPIISSTVGLFYKGK